MSGVTKRKSTSITEDKQHSIPPIRIPKILIEDNRQVIKYHRWLWLFIALQNIVLDFGRPFLALLSTDNYFPLNKPSLGDYAHMLHNLTMSFSIVSLLSHKIPNWVKQLIVIVYMMGASIHLVGDSINHRLMLSGYKNHLSVEENPIMVQLKPRSLMLSFQLLYFYDEFLGHFMWYIPLFLSFYLYFSTSFSAHRSWPSLATAGPMFYLNLALNAAVFWYIITEGQVIEIYIVLMTSFSIMCVLQVRGGRYPDINGVFVFLCFSLSGILVLIWVWYLWSNPILRARYPGVLYVPEPWSVITMRVNVSEIFL